MTKPVQVGGAFYVADPSFKWNLSTDARGNNIKARVAVAPGMKKDEIVSWSAQNEISLLDIRALDFGIIDIAFDETKTEAVLNTPWIAMVEDIPVDEPINYRYMLGERGWGLINPMGRDLNGEGMTVGIGDEGRIGTHADLSAGIDDRASYGVSGHSTLVAGIVTGAGLLDPFYGRGYAPKAKVLVRNFTDILWSTPEYISDFGMYITNNSYGAALNDCAYIGDYNSTSGALDAMMKTYKPLLHVFAAGNSGGMTCAPHPATYGTVAGGYQVSKNVLTVGSISFLEQLSGFSSRGPVDDGRLKPEIVAGGAGRYSTIATNNYVTSSGTSFASPAAMGMATLLYERYKQLHNDSLPDATLIKSIMSNTADDLLSTGPDFLTGYGKINGVRAVELLEQHHYESIDIDHAQMIVKTFEVAGGIASIDVMLMWCDPPAAPFSNQALVNDLDMIIIDPSGDTIRPWQLNYSPTGVNQPAIRGTDHTNNHEQITVSIAEQGTYTVIITGYDIPLGSQQAWLTYDLQKAGVRVQSPSGGEAFRPGTTQYISWDAFSTGNSTFQVEVSLDHGSSWQNVGSTVASNVRFQTWTVNATHTDQLLARVTASNGMRDTSDASAIIMASPSGLTGSSPCDGYLSVSWNAVTNAHHYAVYVLKDEQLSLIDTTSALSYVIHALNEDSAYWVAVAAVFPSGKEGIRSRGISLTPNGGNQCTWDHDLRMQALIGPSTGRQHTSTELSGAEQITVEVINNGTQPATNFSLHYKLDNNATVSEIYADTIFPGETLIYDFTTTEDLSASGQYQLAAWVEYINDAFHQNDTIHTVVRHLSNDAILLPWSEDFESAAPATYSSQHAGLTGLDAWDVELAMGTRVRTGAGASFCRSGNKALTADASRIGSQENGEVVLNLNLSGYDADVDDIRLSFYLMHHELIPDGSNAEAVWVRGSEADPYIMVSGLEDLAVDRGRWQHISGIALSAALEDAGQNYSSSFQIKFSFQVYAPAGQTTSQDGYTIEDLSLHLVERDLTLTQLVHPLAVSCGLDTESFQIEVTNTSDKDVTEVTVYYSINNEQAQATFIGDVPKDTSIVFTLSPAVDFSSFDTYNVTLWLSATGDVFHENDTLRTIVQHSPLVSDFPYREDFENGNAGWLHGGINDSWTLGKPGKEFISRGAEGNNAWTTSLTGTHHSDEISYLYSPCFDITGMTSPWLSFAMMHQLEPGYDYAWVEYRLNTDENWSKLGMQGQGTNWYNHNSHTWNGNQLAWITSGIPLPVTNGTIQLRWVMWSDLAVEYEGFAVDEVHVYDATPVYTGPAMQWTLPVSGNDWIHLNEAGQRVVSIHPGGQDLGNVTITLYKSNQNFLDADSMYLLSRSWVIQSSNPFNEQIMLRGYFTNAEANFLVNASGCLQCIKVRDGFDLGVVHYDGPSEDGSFVNNLSALVHSIDEDSVRITPYQGGYFAEWEADSLSEWWISSPVTHAAGNIVSQIGSESDDAEEHHDNGSVNPVRTALALTEWNGEQQVGLRFRNIRIPQGSYIVSAYLTLTADSDHAEATNLVLQGQLVPDALSFSTTRYNISLRQRTNQVTEWTPGTWLEDQSYNSPELRHIIQEVIHQPGWIPGNDMALLISGNGLRSAWSFDGDPDKSPRLTIVYQPGCNDNGILFVDHQSSGIQDGTSWTNAFRRVEQALEKASHCDEVNEIWVAGGDYAPYPTASRFSGYMLPPGVALYGGFEGNETHPDDRVAGAFPTSLNGDIGSPGTNGDNLYHVMTVMPGPGQALIDGIMILNGLANGTMLNDQRGSGLFINGSVQCRNVEIEDCSAPAVYVAPGGHFRAASTVHVKP